LSSDAPGVASALINVSPSTLRTPPKLPQFVPSYPSKIPISVLRRNAPAVLGFLCAVVPAGTIIALVPVTCKYPLPFGLIEILVLSNVVLICVPLNSRFSIVSIFTNVYWPLPSVVKKLLLEPSAIPKSVSVVGIVGLFVKSL
jgi:hypothetical protein